MFNTKNVLGTTRGARGFCAFLPHRTLQLALVSEAAIAQLGERETEDLKVPSSILGLGNCGSASFFLQWHRFGQFLCVASVWHAGWQRQSKLQRTHVSLHLARIELATFSVLG